MNQRERFRMSRQRGFTGTFKEFLAMRYEKARSHGYPGTFEEFQKYRVDSKRDRDIAAVMKNL